MDARRVAAQEEARAIVSRARFRSGIPIKDLAEVLCINEVNARHISSTYESHNGCKQLTLGDMLLMSASESTRETLQCILAELQLRLHAQGLRISDAVEMSKRPEIKEIMRMMFRPFMLQLWPELVANGTAAETPAPTLKASAAQSRPATATRRSKR